MLPQRLIEVFFKQKVRLTNHEIKHAACFNDSEIDSRLSLIVLTAKSHSSDRNLRNYYRREANVLSMGLLRGCNQQREYYVPIADIADNQSHYKFTDTILLSNSFVAKQEL